MERLRRSFISLYLRGQSEIKTCPTGKVVDSPQASAMRFNDGTADAKSHTGAMRLGGKEGIEDLVRLLRRQARPRIAGFTYAACRCGTLKGALSVGITC